MEECVSLHIIEALHNDRLGTRFPISLHVFLRIYIIGWLDTETEGST